MNRFQYAVRIVRNGRESGTLGVYATYAEAVAYTKGLVLAANERSVIVSF